MTDYRSKVPFHGFPDTLDEQEAALDSHPMMERLARSREFLAHHRHRPVYHYVNPEGMLNDPNGLCRWQDRWHLFYQGYPPEDPRQHWGHAVSDDLMHWRDLPYCIYPDPEERCFRAPPWWRTIASSPCTTARRSATWWPCPAIHCCSTGPS